MIENLLHFWHRAVPDLLTVLIFLPVSFAWLAASAAFAGRLRAEKKLPVAYTRKIFHVSIFTLAGVIQLAYGLSAVVVYGSVVAGGVLYALRRGDGYPFYEAMARPSDAPRRTLFIIIPLLTTALGGVTANILFGSVAWTGYLATGWGDAVGEPVGAAWGKHRYKVPSLGGVPARRSLEGTIAVCVVSALVLLLAYMINGTPAAASARIAVICGLLTGIVEAFSTHGIDNFTIQIAVSGAAWLLAG